MLTFSSVEVTMHLQELNLSYRMIQKRCSTIKGYTFFFMGDSLSIPRGLFMDDPV